MPITPVGLKGANAGLRKLSEVPQQIITTRKANGCTLCERTFKTYWTETLYAKDGSPISVLKGNNPKFINK